MHTTLLISCRILSHVWQKSSDKIGHSVRDKAVEVMLVGGATNMASGGSNPPLDTKIKNKVKVKKKATDRLL